ncbi:glycosyltransferase [Desulfosporosinus acidiphilus SJ4]|uniref:Glycosyltransferase n=1 Tax=Desulfosporosinus acidiphilus (strain DSM 22704 / JCM 16185 / SJ4) TaxID=646529 RepID=I4DBT2_DESAJ|nr:glycosyltransferase family 1 protein [Desulfosporosinus acidiphilus]AFM43256.1 glycosyltransferase [Desulfosporosinus acidiphilus SJ4]
MRVAIDMRAMPRTGIGNYSRILLEEIPRIYSDIVTVPVYDGMELSRQSSLSKLYSSRLKRLAWEQIDLPRYLKENNIDILHNPMNFGLPVFPGCKSLVTVHDVIPAVLKGQYLKSLVERIYYKLAMAISTGRTEYIITDSNFSKQEILKYFAVQEKKIKVIYLGCSEEFKPVTDLNTLTNVRNKFGLHRPYVLTIGGNEPRKNVERLIKIFPRLSETFKIDLAIIGGSWRGNTLNTNSRNADNIFYLGSVDQQDLISLYSMSELFVFPSLYEGFGLPILEAMACGTPVATSNSSSIPEVAGEAAILFDPLNENSIYEVVSGILGSQEIKEELRLRGLERIKLFSWSDTLDQITEAYREALR